jgi:ankyrin repeat protein
MKSIEYHSIIRSCKVTEYLANYEAYSITEVNDLGQSLLHLAIASNCLEISEDLIKRGADVNLVDIRKLSPLHYAAQNNLPDMAKLLISSGAIIDLQNEHGNKALWDAVFNARGNYEIVKMLLESGADANHKNPSNLSPLDFAKRIGDKKLISLLEN